MKSHAPAHRRPGRAFPGGLRPLAFLVLLATVATATAQEPRDAVAFQLPEDPILRDRTTRAAGWLKRHVVSFERPGAARPLHVVAWNDPTLAPDDPKRLAGYLITDTLWSAEALRPFDAAASAELSRSLRSLNWTGNGLQDVLFHPVDRMLHRSDDEDPVHGHSLGVFPVAGGRTVDVRVMRQRWDAGYEAGHPTLFAEHAVYQALHDFWKGRTEAARRRVLGVVHKDGPDDPIFWDADSGILVDHAGREDWERFQKGERPSCRNASFKLGVLLYAIRLLGMEAEIAAPVDGMRRRLWSAQSDDGGVAHFVEVRRGEEGKPARSGATGEATAIAILAETIRRAE